jgi:hypothetical protein
VSPEKLNFVENIYLREKLSQMNDVDDDGEIINRCVVCGVDMGACNPRQYCMKLYCPKQFEPEPEVVDLTDDPDPQIIDLTDDPDPQIIDLTGSDK